MGRHLRPKAALENGTPCLRPKAALENETQFLVVYFVVKNVNIFKDTGKFKKILENLKNLLKNVKNP